MIPIEQRHEIYVKALELYNDGVEDRNKHNYDICGLCNYITEAAKTFDYYSHYLHNAYWYMGYYPEVERFKPSTFNGYWFPTNTKVGIAKRISILKKAIKATTVNKS